MHGASNDSGPSLERQRERAVAALADHFARDDIELDELERRIDDVQSARTGAAVSEALAGLPALPVPAQPAATPAPMGAKRTGGVPRVNAVVSVMSGTTRRGGWAPAPRLYVAAVMGGAELDFRDARLSAGTTDVYLVGCMGGVEIILPPDLPVEISGFAIMGGWDEPADARHPLEHGRAEEYQGEPRLLRIRGLAFMGAVAVSVRLPGESARDAKKRRRAERRLEGGTAP